MRTFQCSGDSTITENQTESMDNEDLIKVKVTHLLVTDTDVNIFAGRCKLPDPITIGQVAIGVISDDVPKYELKRGMKVILDPYFNTFEDNPDNEEIKTKGVDSDGFFADYVMLSRDKIILFPENVDEQEAIFTVYIACALRIINIFNANKTDQAEYVSILGSDPISCILAQLALYYNYIPIVIDNGGKGLQLVKDKGIYYTIDPIKEVPLTRVKEITGGRMVKFAMINLNQQNNTSFFFPTCCDDARCVIYSAEKTVGNINADISFVAEKQLRVTGISNGYSEMLSAVNILAQGILDLKGFIDMTTDYKNAEVAMRELAENPDAHYTLVLTF